MKKTQNFMEILMVGLVNPDFDRHISKSFKKLKKNWTYKIKAFVIFFYIILRKKCV